MQTWKVPHIVKGMLTFVPIVNALRMRRGSTGGSSSSRYCYAVWLRHLVILSRFGFKVKGATIGELGPGDSIGTGLAGLLSGAKRYVGLDVVPYSANADLHQVLRELAALYASREPIPDHKEFPLVRPRLTSYEFPEDLVRTDDLSQEVERIRLAIAAGLDGSGDVSYRAPWTSSRDVAAGSLDLIFSQGVLQCVNDLEGTYRAMFDWLKPGGYGSHSTGCGANNFSPFWNGHWAYSEREWRIVRGRREWLPNREPASTHLRIARAVGFEVVHVEPQYDDTGLPVSTLSAPFKHLAADDLRTRGAMIVLRKPLTAR